ncbi:MAG TPA: DUF4386 family protein [Candidatus Limnocylindrales bacterium]|nr:DUF4386 family protein [Candidatus Limnocylindrales bacterium]
MYFVLAVVGQATGSAALNVIGTAWYFVVSVALSVLFAQADRRLAFAAVAFAGIGCVVQAVGQVQADPAVLTRAIAFFGLFEIALGYLIVRSGFAPRWLGAVLALAGIMGLIVVLAEVPNTFRFAVVAASGLSELALVIWLITRAVRR